MADHDADNSLELAGPPEPRRWRGLLVVPAWLVSLAMHLALLLTMAAYTVEPIRNALTSLTIESSTATPLEEVDSIEVSQVDIDVRELSEQTEMTPLAATPLEQLLNDTPPVTTVEPIAMGVGPVEVTSPVASMVPGDLLAESMAASMTAAMTGRSVAGREELLKKFGGNDATEKAVAMGLKWLAAHQMSDGSWSFAHSRVCNGQCGNQTEKFPQARNAATGLALMAFLGAGQTHREGDYKEVVHKGLAFLLTQMRTGRVAGVSVGSWFDDPAPMPNNGLNLNHHYRMYGHAIATTAVCEAFGMTKDPKLGEAAQLGVNYLVAVQDPKGGGWRYAPFQKGDTSVVGWVMMALKSAYISGLVFPQETIRRTSSFLDYVQLDGGARYDYAMPGDRSSEEWALTACGALCRMYMGVPKEHPGLQAAVANLAKAGPSRKDSYLNYYGSQVLKQYGGEPWANWNKKMQETLVTTQINTGHAAGSWTPEGGHDSDGGRLYTTCMSIMVLEVYYRYLPIYHEQAEDEAFEL